MRDYVRGKMVKEATLRFNEIDVHKKEFKDKAAKAARSDEKKAAARVRSSHICTCSMCSCLSSGIHVRQLHQGRRDS